jgi:O-antigen ligase
LRFEIPDRAIMTVETDAAGLRAGPLTRFRRLYAWRASAVYSRCTDILLAIAAASLPWSTSLSTIFISLWLVAVIPTIDWEQLVLDLARPACALPLLFFALAIFGTLWSDAAWAERLHGIKPVAKLLLMPFLLYRFQRSPRGAWVITAFLVSCTLMMILSWIVLFFPQLKLTQTASAGVPVKNYIDQSQEFALCAFALALPALRAFRERQWPTAIGCAALSLVFVVNMLFVASARAALIYMPVLLALFASRHLSRRAMGVVFGGAVVAGMLVWTTSPYLRERVADIATEYHHGDENRALASTAQRLTYWRKSIRFFIEAPLFGHGTGSIRQLFERDAVGQSGLSAEVTRNPHNQTLNVAVQWGLLGAVVLYGMWLSHLLLFRGEGLVGWIGLVVVVQNVVSSLFNSHLFDFHEGWIYVLGVGIAGGESLRARCAEPGLKSCSEPLSERIGPAELERHAM